MLPKISLMEELKKGGYEASLTTTYNAYLPFYEEVVLRRLVNAGVRHNVLLMDAQQYAASLTVHPPRLAGRQYSLLPVRVPGAFHPKLVFLTGKTKGAILIGSHNMTLAGFGFNREMTNLVRIQGDDDGSGIALAQAVWTEIEYWLDTFTDGIPDHVRAMTRRVKEFAPWLNMEPLPDTRLGLLAARPGGESLWQQFIALLGGETARISIGGAFFDQELNFLHRVKDELQPKRMTVAVDPGTVQMPVRAHDLEGVSFVRADGLGCDENSENRYLHAKFILAEQTGGASIFSSGSANPSRPAWFADGISGNVELMLARVGNEAELTANALGCGDIHNLPALTTEDWDAIQVNQAQEEETSSAGIRSGVALAEDTRVLFDPSLLTDFEDLSFTLNAADGSEVCQAGGLTVEDGFAVLDFEARDIDKATTLHGTIAGGVVLKLILHHAGMVEEQAGSGTQRRFKDALLSLESDTPDIALLIQCIDKIIFDEDSAVPTQSLRKSGARSTDQPNESDVPETLAIDVSEMKKRGKKRRLEHSSDFAYLLDALIFHLRMQEEKSHEETDRFGRTEEEQIGADDDSDGQITTLTSAKQADLLRICHSKVRTIINRMLSQLEAFSEGKQPLPKVLVRLLGVLAVLRELRTCDGRAAWVAKGTTTVPRDQRLHLLEAVMLNLFERDSSTDTSLLSLEPLGEDFRESDDVARLKGLLLWLAWDCGLTLNLQKPFRESPEAGEQRLKQNAMILALAQIILSDEVVIHEARQSIGGLTSIELEWLQDIQRLADDCAALGRDVPALQKGENAEAGDIAFHRTAQDWIIRMVAGRNGNKVSLVALREDKPRLTYRADHLAVTQLSFGDPSADA
ncbi:hypothetical protein E0J02_07060 [Rhizobium leguminosarum bv. viciae]|nr:hypothetical protein E0J18_04230 [Rhizobium leguminosarum bv. viciae]TCB44847.1 hypothetical protein E0J02_07060 [Rhizobium leguminosarum bv. viciae]